MLFNIYMEQFLAGLRTRENSIKYYAYADDLVIILKFDKIVKFLQDFL